MNNDIISIISIVIAGVSIVLSAFSTYVTIKLYGKKTSLGNAHST